MNTIEIAGADEEIPSTYWLMKQLRPHVSESEYLPLVRQQEEKYGYRLVTLKQDGRLVCVAGFRISQSLAWGTYLYVDDLVTDEQQRSRGAGSAIMKWLIEFAREHNCGELHLDSGVQRHEAHRFYLRERMDIVFYHFRIRL
jgi:GNAT superfamily N-acetyltransferase